jgi:vacuolar protein sorting-associated protein 13A/C
VLQGSAVMRNLKLKNSVFDRFNLPVTVREGYLGMISISVPWTKLESQSTVVNIRDLYILAVPSTKVSFD